MMNLIKEIEANLREKSYMAIFTGRRWEEEESNGTSALEKSLQLPPTFPTDFQ